MAASFFCPHRIRSCPRVVLGCFLLRPSRKRRRIVWISARIYQSLEPTRNLNEFLSDRPSSNGAVRLVLGSLLQDVGELFASGVGLRKSRGFAMSHYGHSESRH